MKDEVEKYLEKVADEYKPKKSIDPLENECADCTFTEMAHRTKGLKK